MKRRQFNKGITALGLSTLMPVPFTHSKSKLIERTIPSTGESVPIIGMGSWLTFDVMGNPGRMQNMKSVLRNFHALGGRVIDSSPMYGSSEKVIGQLARELDILDDLWVSTKIWTNGKANGQSQLKDSRTYFDDQLMVDHVHNIRDFKTHYATLRDAKINGQIKYIGVTHYQNHAHEQLEGLIREHQLDFVQINYNIDNPHAEERLIPTAADHGVAVIINRPFQTGRLFDLIAHSKLPAWAAEMKINNWAAWMLRYIVSNPGVTCVIPATTQVSHVKQNMEAGTGYLPDSQEREKMREYFQTVRG